MQQSPETGAQSFSQQRIIVALTNLSALALQASTLRFSPPETADRLATVFLDQLVTLCEAQHGAFFLLHPFMPEAVQTLPSRSLLARTHLSVEEAQKMLTHTVPIPAGLQAGPMYVPQAMHWTRSLDASFAPMVHTNTPAPSDAPAYSAVLLFAWSTTDQTAQEEAQRQALQRLPFLADLVDTILFHMLTALHEGQQPGEVFPTEMLATVGHEFRGPLTAIQGYATTLLRHDQRLALEERQEFLHAINEASTHLGTLVDRFLELAQLEAHAHTFLPVPVNLLTLAQESITMIQRSGLHHLLLAPEMAQQEALDGDGKSEPFPDELTLSGDRRLLRTMLDLILENAVAYSAPESLIEVTIAPITAAAVFATLYAPSQTGAHRALILSARFQERESLLTMRVRDHGIGISPEHLALIFRRFYRVDTRLTRDVNGLGLGLALCKAIVALHRGMLWVESAVGEGSIFTLILPCEIAPDMDASSGGEPLKEGLEHHL